MNPLSKLQSEAVKELMSIEDFEESLRFDLNEDWYERTPLEKERVIKLLLSDQIQKVYSNGREEENFVNDLLLECWFQFAYETGNNELWAGGLSTLEHLYDYLKSKGIIDSKGRHIILSIQSKGKIK